jgi:alkyl hydroperoxide reductase subunit AhpF
VAIALDELLSVPGVTVVATERSAALGSPLWERLVSLAPWLRFEHIAAEPDEPPHTELRAERAHGAITFVGVIAGRQLPPLVETLRALATGRPEFDTPATPARLAELEQRVHILVAVSPTCPFCPRVAAQALRLACASPNVEVTVVRADTGLAPAQVSSVPSVMVDDELVATGSIGEYDLLERILRQTSVAASGRRSST